MKITRYETGRGELQARPQWVHIACRLSITLAILAVCDPGMTGARGRDHCYSCAENNRLLFGNALVEMELDRSSGYIRGLRNKQTGSEFRVAGEGVWPFGLRTGNRAEPHRRQMEICNDGRQAMTYEVFRDEATGALTLRMLYPNLKDNRTGEASGVQLIVPITIEPTLNYFRVSASLLNRGDEEITEFYAFRGAGLRSNDGTSGKLILPYGAGQLEAQDLRAGLTLPSPSIFLSMGWADLSGSKGGVGMGYLNRQDVQAAVDIKQIERSAEISWTFFNLEKIASRFGLHRQPAIYPIGPGEWFDTDEWLLVVHDGDWHKTADAYRGRYEASFAGDYTSWSQTSPAAKQIDIWAGMKTMNWWPWTPKTMPKGFRFDTSMPATMKGLCGKFGAEPANVGVSCMQTRLGIENPLPDFHTCAEYLGGCDAYSRMVRLLQNEGYPAVFSYVFFWDQKKEAKTYTSDAAPGIPAEGKLLPNNICLDNWAAYKQWNDVIIPGLARLGVKAVYFDLGSMFSRLCEEPSHVHGRDSLGVLTAGARGIKRMLGAFRTALGPGDILVTEAKDDVRGRYYDIWHGPTSEVIRYTQPARLVTLDAQFLGGNEGQTVYRMGGFKKISTAGEMATFALLTGCQLITTPLSLQADSIEETRQFVRLRRELRNAHAPGYPEGFRDTVGIEVTHPDLDARGFTDGSALTIVYCNWGKAPLEGVIKVRGQALQIPRIGDRTRSVKLKPHEAGYSILH